MAAEAEDVRLRLRRKMEEMVGVDEADLLLDRPPGGWGELVTKDWLHLELSVIESKIAALDVKFAAKFDAVEVRFDAVDGRFDALESKFDAKFDGLESKFDAKFDGLESKVDAKFDGLESKVDAKIASELNKQPWRLMTAMLSGMAILTAVFGAFVAFVVR